MTKKKAILLVVIAGALVGFYRAGAPHGAARQPEPAGPAATLARVPARVGHGVGIVAARIIAPAVRNMVANTERDLELLRSSLRTATVTQSRRMGTRDGIAQVAAMDSTALADLTDGNPMHSFKLAIQASGLVAALRDNLRAN